MLSCQRTADRIEIIGLIEGVKTLNIGVARCTIDLFDLRDAMLLLGLTQQNVRLTVEPLESPEKKQPGGQKDTGNAKSKTQRKAGSKRTRR